MAVFYTLLNTTTFQLNTFNGRTALYLCLGIPSIIFLLLGNALVISAVFTQRALKKPSYYILTSLAITDVITGAIAIPIELYRRTVTNDFTCSGKWDVYLSSLTYMTGCDSLLHMVIITFDRYMAVHKPLRYSALMTPKRIVIMVILSWLFSAIFAIGQIVFGSVAPTIPAAYCSGFRIAPTPITTTNDIFIFCLINSSNLAVVIFNVMILRTAVRQSRRIAAFHSASHSSASTSDSRDVAMRQVKASRLIVCVVIAFLICHTPFSLVHLILGVSDNFIFNSVLQNIGFMFFMTSSAINPVIYCQMDRVFRESALRMIRPLWGNRSGIVEANATSTTDQSMTYTAP